MSSSRSAPHTVSTIVTRARVARPSFTIRYMHYELQHEDDDVMCYVVVAPIDNYFPVETPSDPSPADIIVLRLLFYKHVD